MRYYLLAPNSEYVHLHLPLVEILSTLPKRNLGAVEYPATLGPLMKTMVGGVKEKNLYQYTRTHF